MSSFSGIKNTLLAEQVEEQLYEYITKLPMKAGDKLPNEFKLAEMFGVGRSTVREAVKLLVSRNVLETRRGSGTYVKDLVPMTSITSRTTSISTPTSPGVARTRWWSRSSPSSRQRC